MYLVASTRQYCNPGKPDSFIDNSYIVQQQTEANRLYEKELEHPKNYTTQIALVLKSTDPQHESVVEELIQEIQSVQTCCQEGIDGDWDVSAEGFLAMQEGLQKVIDKLKSFKGN